MSGFSDYQENALLDSLLGSTTYLALSTADPGETGATIAEPTDAAYGRATILAGDWAAAASGVKATANAIAFASPTANWGTLTHIALFDAASAGNMLMHAQLAYTKEVLSGADPPTFAAGDLSVTLD